MNLIDQAAEIIRDAADVDYDAADGVTTVWRLQNPAEIAEALRDAGLLFVPEIRDIPLTDYPDWNGVYVDDGDALHPRPGLSNAVHTVGEAIDYWMARMPQA